eukprot:SAG11_NODE_3891_length_2163_cov_1.973837_3_plen_92_part_00
MITEHITAMMEAEEEVELPVVDGVDPDTIFGAKTQLDALMRAASENTVQFAAGQMNATIAVLCGTITVVLNEIEAQYAAAKVRREITFRCR